MFENKNMYTEPPPYSPHHHLAQNYPQATQPSLGPYHAQFQPPSPNPYQAYPNSPPQDSYPRQGGDSMGKMVSRLKSGVSSHLGVGRGTSKAAQVLTVRPSPYDSGAQIIHPAGYPEDAPPMFTVVASGSKRLVLFRGTPGPQTMLGEASHSQTKGKVELMLRGQKMKMKQNEFTGDYSMETPQMGKMKWKVNKLTGSGMELCDSQGRALAKFGSSGFPGVGGKQFQLYQPLDDYVLELMVLSAVAGKALMRAQMETASEVLQAVAGA